MRAMISYAPCALCRREEGMGTQAADPSILSGTEPDPEYPYVLVMPCGERSLFHLLTAQRIAGFEHVTVQQIFRRLVKLVAVLHSKGIAHNGLKVEMCLFFLFPS